MKMRSSAATLCFTLVALAVGGFSVAHPTTDDPKKLIYGDEQPLGEGSVRTWVRLNGSGEPDAIGVTFSQRALETLPAAEALPAPFHMLNLSLALPAEAAKTGFDHVLFDWNAVGHDPLQLYSAPHFDVHFYMIDTASRLAINPSDPEFEAKGMKAPDADMIPVDYISPPGNLTVPQMGTHWLDMHAPELNGQPFSETMIYGYYDGQMIFIEPMLTLEYLQGRPNLVKEIKQPKRYPKSGFYPTSYVIRYDEADGTYTVAIEGLTKRS